MLLWPRWGSKTSKVDACRESREKEERRTRNDGAWRNALIEIGSGRTKSTMLIDAESESFEDKNAAFSQSRSITSVLVSMGKVWHGQQ